MAQNRKRVSKTKLTSVDAYIKKHSSRATVSSKPVVKKTVPKVMPIPEYLIAPKASYQLWFEAYQQVVISTDKKIHQAYKKHKKFFIIGMKRTKELLEYSDKISVSNKLLLSFQDNLKSYLKKIDLYTEIKIILLPKFSEDITESILNFL